MIQPVTPTRIVLTVLILAATPAALWLIWR